MKGDFAVKYIIENDKLKVSFRALGGELTSIKSKKDDVEYLWNGNETYWKYHAPVLFPIVGKVENNEYIAEGKTYVLPQHGLGRLHEYEVIKETPHCISFKLTYNDELLEIYPYKFTLVITYTLKEDTITVEYKVYNDDYKLMYFSIGGHPAFMCPLFEGETFTDYYLKFDQKEDFKLMKINSEGLFERREEDYLKNADTIPLSLDLFKSDALVFQNLKSSTIAIKTDKHSRSVTMDFSQFPYLGVWTMSTGAPFLCLEPWHGHADYEDFSGDISNKPGMLSLTPGQNFSCSYDIIIS